MSICKDQNNIPDVKPLVSFLVQFIVFITQFLRRYSFLECLSFRRSAILVRATDVERALISRAFQTMRGCISVHGCTDHLRLYLRRVLVYDRQAMRYHDVPRKNISTQSAADDVSCVS